MSEEKTGWFARLRQGLSKTSHKLTEGITAVFTKRKLDQEALDELEALLIQADLGASIAASVIARFSAQRFGKEVTDEEVKQFLATDIAALLAPYAGHSLLTVAPTRPLVVMMVGVNGNGKTTTLGKMAHYYQAQGKRVMLAAADTFRAAAVEQLKVWGERNRCEVVAGSEQSDAASVAFRALEEARAKQVDILFVDTAGRLQNKANLMAELTKITKVLKKIDPDAPHAVLQVLDATTGQNALSQVEIFKDQAGVNGLVVTKLDGTAKGGVIVALAETFKLPLYAVGVGEQIEDLKPFTAEEFARNLVGLGPM